MRSFDAEDHGIERPPAGHVHRSPTTSRRRKNGVRKPEDPNPLKEMEQVDSIARAAAALDNAGNELFEKGDYDKAMSSYVRALKLKRRSLQMAERGHVDGVHVRFEGDSDSQQGSGASGSESLSSKHHSHEFLLASVATSLNNIGYLRQRTGEATTEESMACYQDALRIKQEVLGHDNLSFGKTLNNLASVHYLKKEYDLAIDSYRKALYILEGHLGTHHLDVGTVYSNLGDVFWAQRNGPLAVEHYRRALEIRWYHLGEHDPKVVRLLEKIALIELKETSLNLDDSAAGPDGGYHDTDTDDDDRDPTAPSRLLVQLHDQVGQDMTYVDDMKRKMAVLMVKDRLRVLRDMKNMDTSSSGVSGSDEDAESILAAASASTSTPAAVTKHPSKRSFKSHAFSPSERQQALDSVKKRLAKLRASRSDSNRSLMSTNTTPELIRTADAEQETTPMDRDDSEGKHESPMAIITTTSSADTNTNTNTEYIDDDVGHGTTNEHVGGVGSPLPCY